ncbi:hypothetical protein SAMN05444380_10557 [Thermophagus xiamenensis]|uniref:Uncharacterized protein n=1 Tax=Thermophagus xiamenensis TaxID=385682 RepID=A0A1I1X1B1_9BACT|nr:hypothetical protein SAMN05444380_10557 [Thermophagus xiamenensis]
MLIKFNPEVLLNNTRKGKAENERLPNSGFPNNCIVIYC